MGYGCGGYNNNSFIIFLILILLLLSMPCYGPYSEEK